VTQLGLDIGASLTGEGTETLEQLDALNTLGVEQAHAPPARRPPLTERPVVERRSCGLYGTDAAEDTSMPVPSSGAGPHPVLAGLTREDGVKARRVRV
jgi:hypothetical protein